MDTVTHTQSRAERLLLNAGVLCVLTVDSVEQALSCARALADGGLTAIELTLRTPVAIDAISAIRHDLPQLAVGAGTVLEPAQVAAVEAAGGDFIVTPGVSPELLDALAASSLPSVPGAATPSELIALHARGFHVAKWFPAAMLGGIPTLKALQGPLPQMKLCANGGIDATSAADYLAQPNVLCVGGSWMVAKEWLAAGDWDKVRAAAKEAAGIVKRARGG
ncbi:MAG TPA: bifunctional 4-hydroxy-2-oxoglutarate aldolase/2-dehydro-3-deoxy-phosphogluconate aldolase [Lysobacter sp.]|jgi:2-dehydro-3-deoxyphosphogluconate aldolase/(4S)-4-hydroxy-2-oxoglutarate aldolase|nr:bifunctional 4-hydroxy-2-oxoglutarate aldolase/2-dehydro-3-deoxy-phosphogluconate aldolase [Lysobacter sp.]